MCKTIVLFFEQVSQNSLFYVPMRIMWLESNVHVMHIVFLLLSVFNIFFLFLQNGEEYEFEYELRSLTYYGVQHGDDILIRQIPWQRAHSILASQLEW